MKKKLNLLWNLKFNFFSVAERPLTFFAYFLNAKKVGRRRLVIGPAKAGAFLFFHTRLPLSPRWGRRPASAVPPQAKWSRTAASTGFCGAKTEMKSRRCGVAKPRGCNPRPHAQPATARAGGLPPSNKPCEEVPRPICHGSGKHRFSRSGNRDEIEEVKQNAMSLV